MLKEHSLELQPHSSWERGENPRELHFCTLSYIKAFLRMPCWANRLDSCGMAPAHTLFLMVPNPFPISGLLGGPHYNRRHQQLFCLKDKIMTLIYKYKVNLVQNSSLINGGASKMLQLVLSMGKQSIAFF